MRERIFFAQPRIGCQHWNTLRREGTVNIVGTRHQDTHWQPRCDDVRVLIHCEDRHPMRSIIAERQRAIDIAHRICERAATWYNQQRYMATGSGYLRKDGIEVSGSCKQAAADFDDNGNSQGTALWLNIVCWKRTPACDSMPRPAILRKVRE